MTARSFLLLFTLVLCSCHADDARLRSPGAGRDATTPAKDTAESFKEFNRRFHSDTAFQLSRVAFPIGGQYADGEERYTWTARNWEFLCVPVKDSVDNSEYKHTTIRNRETVVEKYWIDSSGFRFERHFTLRNGQWFLTYCDDIDL